MLRYFISVVFLLITFIGYSQKQNDSTMISNYLYDQLDYKQNRLSCQVLDSISSIEFYSTTMKFTMGDGSCIPTEFFFYKTGTTFKKVHSSMDLVCTDDFINSLGKKIRITNRSDALKFQDIMNVVDSWNNLNTDRKVFKVDNSWYFIRDRFFDKYDVFEIQVSSKGKIELIKYHKHLQGLNVPEDIVDSYENQIRWGYKKPHVNSEDSTYLRDCISKEINFHFEYKKLSSRLVEKFSAADFYNCKIVFTQEGYSNANAFYLMKYNNQVQHANSARELLEKDLFFSSISSDFDLLTEDDALTVEEAIDVIAPLGTFDKDKKEHFKQAGKWFFVRRDFFDKKCAFVLETNNEGKITSFYYDNKVVKQ